MTLARPACTVVMAVKDGAAVVGAAIESVLQQTSGDFELLVVDDGSTDTTREVLAGFAHDERVRVIRNEVNVGSGASRNRAIAEARGAYIAVADADDLQLPGRLATQLAEFRARPELAVVGGQLEEWGEWGGPVLSRWPVDERTIRDSLERGRMAMAHCAATMSKEAVDAVGGYDVYCRRAQDFALMRKLRAEPMIAVPDVVTRYRTTRPLPLDYVIANGRYADLAKARTRAARPSTRTRVLAPPQSLAVDLRSVVTWARRRRRERLP